MILTVFIRLIVLVLRRHTVIAFLLLTMFTVHPFFGQEGIKTDMFGLDVLTIDTIRTFTIRTMFTLPLFDFINTIL